MCIKYIKIACNQVGFYYIVRINISFVNNKTFIINYKIIKITDINFFFYIEYEDSFVSDHFGILMNGITAYANLYKK